MPQTPVAVPTTSSAEASSMDTRPVRILLVAGDEGAYQSTRDLLAGTGRRRYAVDRAATYDAALAAMRRGEHDVYLVDSRLGGRGGLDLLREAVRAGCRRPIILLTGEGDRVDGAEASAAGAVDHLPKADLTPALLERAVRYAAERARGDEYRERLLGREQAARAESEAARRRALYLAEASARLAASLDYEATLAGVARLLVEELADYCTIDLVAPDGSVRRVAAVHRDPAKADLVARLKEMVPAAGVGHPKLEVLASGRPVLVPEVTDAWLARIAPEPEKFQLLKRLGATSRMTVPLTARGRVLGAMTLGSERRRYGEADLALAEQLADRAAVAVDNARLYAEAQAAERRYRDLVDSLDAVVWEADATTQHVSFVSRYAERLLGYPLAQWLAGPEIWRTLVHREDFEAVAAACTAATAAGRDHTLEYRAVAADGRVLWVRDVVHVTPAADGRPARLRGVIVDITERKEVEEATRRLAAIVEWSDDAIIGRTFDGIVTSWNAAAERIFGYAAGEMLGRSVSILVPPEGPNDLPFIQERLQRGERVEPYETVRMRKDGSRIHISLAVAPIRDEAGRTVGASSIARDITARKRAEEALRRSEEQLRQGQKMEAIGRLAGGIAHDFNNLLTAIAGYSTLLVQELAGHDKLLQDVREIQKATDRAADLTRQLLAFSRQQVLQPTVLDPNGVIADMTRMLRRLIGEDIELVSVLAPGLGRVRADQGQLEQVLLNLVVNARDAMPGGGRLTIETANVELDETYARSHVGVQPGAYVMLTVSDTGCGMSPEVRARVFEPFFTTKEKGKGTGLGLATVYGIVKQSGGNVWVYSEPGHGTTVKVYLPRLDAPAHGERPAAAAARVGGSETILVVEDEEGVRKLVRKALERLGYSVLEARTGDEALRLSAEHRGPIALLLTDLVMPGMRGPDLARRLTASRPDMRVMYMSGYTENAALREEVLAPGVAFLSKPFTPELLARKVRDVLDGRRDLPHPAGA